MCSRESSSTSVASGLLVTVRGSSSTHKIQSRSSAAENWCQIRQLPYMPWQFGHFADKQYQLVGLVKFAYYSLVLTNEVVFHVCFAKSVKSHHNGTIVVWFCRYFISCTPFCIVVTLLCFYTNWGLIFQNDFLHYTLWMCWQQFINLQQSFPEILHEECLANVCWR